MKNKGSILIIALWILSILVLFAVSFGHRMSMEIKIAGYHSDRLKAFNLAKAGLRRAAWEKQREIKENISDQVDVFSEPWGNNEDALKDISLGEGTFTVKYEYFKGTEERKPSILYGLSDETAKININEADFDTLAEFFKIEDTSESDAKEIAASIIDWRDEDAEISNDPNTNLPCGAEDEYYQEQKKPYSCKNAPFDCLEELLLVKGVTKELFSGAEHFLTIHGDGKININTAPRPVLSAVTGEAFPDLADKIIEYRTGIDGKPGTSDDRWFVKGEELLLEAEESGIVETKNLDGDLIQDPYFGVTPNEWDRLKSITQGSESTLDVVSKVFRAESYGHIENTVKKVIAVLEFDDEGEYKIIAWREE